MILPYDIARCAGERDHSGNRPQQCIHCARYRYNAPKHCHPYYQSWMEPHRDAMTGTCAFHIAPQTTDTPAP